MVVVVIIGVSGAGKSTIGRELARHLNWSFHDADDFHSSHNVAKMSSGQALTDEDRQPWLQALAAAMKEWHAAGENAVLACSALKQRYRDVLLAAVPKVRIVFLKADEQTVIQRLMQRKDHFMKVDMLESQLRTLEEPAKNEALVVDASKLPQEIVSEIADDLLRLKLY